MAALTVTVQALVAAFSAHIELTPQRGACTAEHDFDKKTTSRASACKCTCAFQLELWSSEERPTAQLVARTRRVPFEAGTLPAPPSICMGATLPVQSSAGVCVQHGLCSVNEATSHYVLMEQAVYAAALAFVGTFADRWYKLYLLRGISVTQFSTEGRFGRRQLFQNFIGCRAFSWTFARTPPG